MEGVVACNRMLREWELQMPRTQAHGAGMGDPSGRGIALSYVKNMRRRGVDPVNRLLPKHESAAITGTQARPPSNQRIPLTCHNTDLAGPAHLI